MGKITEIMVNSRLGHPQAGARLEDMQQLAAPSTWYLFEIPVAAVLDFLERKTGQPFPQSPAGPSEANKWHLALRQGMRTHLHLNVGIPGVEEPAHPIEEHACALHAALLLGWPKLKVILSGEWEIAVAEGLITQHQLAAHEAAMRAAFPED